ncbi:MAG: hypothetical protein ACRELA_07245, partial [Candidatus Rokuibacteriota bacterium]
TVAALSQAAPSASALRSFGTPLMTARLSLDRRHGSAARGHGFGRCGDAFQACRNMGFELGRERSALDDGGLLDAVFLSADLDVGEVGDQGHERQDDDERDGEEGGAQ